MSLGISRVFLTYIAGLTPSTRFLGCFYFYTATGFLHAVSSGYGLSDPANHIVHLLPTRSSRYFVVGICRTSSFAQLLRLLSSATSLFSSFRYALAAICNGPHGYFHPAPPPHAGSRRLLLIPCFHQSHRWADAFLRHTEYIFDQDAQNTRQEIRDTETHFPPIPVMFGPSVSIHCFCQMIHPDQDGSFGKRGGLIHRV